MKRPYRGLLLSVGGIMQSIDFYFKDTSACGLPLQMPDIKLVQSGLVELNMLLSPWRYLIEQSHSPVK